MCLLYCILQWQEYAYTFSGVIPPNSSVPNCPQKTKENLYKKVKKVILHPIAVTMLLLQKKGFFRGSIQTLALCQYLVRIVLAGCCRCVKPT